MVSDRTEDMISEKLLVELLVLFIKQDEYLQPILIGTAQEAKNSRTFHDDALDGVRLSVCNWNYECVDYFMFDREVAYISMNYFDRFMTLFQNSNNGGGTMTPTKLAMMKHLLALSCLNLACKLYGKIENHPDAPVIVESGEHRHRPPKMSLRIQDFCNMSRGAYCATMIEEMEMTLLVNLQWKLHPPTPMDFLRKFAMILSLLLNGIDDNSKSDKRRDNHDDEINNSWSVFEVSRYQVELAVYNHGLCQDFSPSKVALAAFLNAMNSTVVRSQRSVICSHVRERFMQQIYSLGERFSHIHDEDEIIVIRKMLKNLCPQRIALPGKMQDKDPPIVCSDVTEYELPEIQPLIYESKVIIGNTTFLPVDMLMTHIS